MVFIGDAIRELFNRHTNRWRPSLKTEFRMWYQLGMAGDRAFGPSTAAAMACAAASFVGGNTSANCHAACNMNPTYSCEIGDALNQHMVGKETDAALRARAGCREACT